MAKLYFYYAAMNAGKSTVLLQSAYNYQERGMDALLFTAKIDNRYGQGIIQSRIGLKSTAIVFDDLMNIFYVTKNALDQNAKIHCVLIDEAQFLTKMQVLQLSDIVDQLNIPVLAYGLRSDFLGEPFTGSLALLVWADILVEIKTICHCGKKAIMNLRVDDFGKPIKEGDQIHIGGNDRYLSVCRRHFREAMI